MTAVRVMFLGKVYGWYREVHNLKHDIMEHMETETSEGNIPFQFLATKIRLKEERELDHDTCYLAKEKVEENGMNKGPRDKILASFVPTTLSLSWLLN